MTEVGDYGQIVILNGPPRSGKSSIAQAIQGEFEGVWLNLGVDASMAMTPARYRPGVGLRPGGERPDLEPLIVRLYDALYDSIAAYSRRGINVVVDAVHHDDYSEPLNIIALCADRLQGLPVLFVGVRCSVEVALERRRATWGGEGFAASDAEAHPVVRWHGAVHTPGNYDLDVDTTQRTPAECARLIRERLRSPSLPSAFFQQPTADETARHPRSR